MTAQLSQFARSLSVETAFTVLAVAKNLKAAGKDVVELEIGDSPFDSTASAKAAGIEAIQRATSRITAPRRACPEFREAAARFVKREFGIPAEAEERRRRARGPRSSSSSSARRFSIPATACSSSARTFPPTCRTSQRRGRGPSFGPLQAGEPVPARPRRRRAVSAEDQSPPRRSSSTRRTTRPAASPPRRICSGIADLVRGKNIAVFSDEPYCHMVWKGKHRSLPGAAGHAGPVRRGLHLQQVVQHERLAAGLRRLRRRDRRRRSAR